MADLVTLTEADLAWWIGVAALVGASIGALVVSILLYRRDVRQAVALTSCPHRDDDAEPALVEMPGHPERVGGHLDPADERAFAGIAEQLDLDDEADDERRTAE